MTWIPWCLWLLGRAKVRLETSGGVWALFGVGCRDCVYCEFLSQVVRMYGGRLVDDDKKVEETCLHASKLRRCLTGP